MTAGRTCSLFHCQNRSAIGRDEDVFLHIEVLRRSGLADLQPGEAVSLRVVEGKRGRMAMQVTSWEAALKDHD